MKRCALALALALVAAVSAPTSVADSRTSARSRDRAAATATADDSVLERNKHPSRDGFFVQPAFTRAAAARMLADVGFRAEFKGIMAASPLFVQDGPRGRGVFFAVTTGNDVYALDESTGAVLWRRNIGPSPMSNGGNPTCGAAHPLGILSTPVIDPVSRTIFVAGAIGTTSILRHEVHALSLDDGGERPGWPVDVSKMRAGTATFDTVHQNQRGALSLVDGKVYVPYGGHLGDCGDFRGWVMAIDARDPTKRGAWATGGIGEGIWATGGMASDGVGVFATTGNRTRATDAPHQDSEELVRITGMGTRADVFIPRRWREMDHEDADFAGVNPVVVELPGSKPARIVVAIAKDGHLYILDAGNLGGLGGEKRDIRVASYSDSIRTVPTVYRTPRGVHVAFSVKRGPAGCPRGTTADHVVMSVRLTPGSPPGAAVAWCAPLAGADAAPISTTIDGEHEPIVWYVSDGRLTAVDGETGVLISSSRDICGPVLDWTSPIAVKGRLVVGRPDRLCAWSPSR